MTATRREFLQAVGLGAWAASLPAVALVPAPLRYSFSSITELMTLIEEALPGCKASWEILDFGNRLGVAIETSEGWRQGVRLTTRPEQLFEATGDQRHDVAETVIRMFRWWLDQR